MHSSQLSSVKRWMEKKSKQKSANRHYCCVCRNYRGKLVDCKNVTLHRFPSNVIMRMVWLKRIKVISQNFKLNLRNDRLCSAHFKGGVYVKVNVPSVFILNDGRVKTFATTAEEEQIVCREMQMLQKRMSQPDVSNPQLCDYLCRLVFCCMLGYDVSFCHIHAVKLAQQGVGINKRIGYLSVALLLHEDHEMIVLLINTIQKDLKSSNLLDNYMALTAASQLVNAESIPTVLPLVLDKLKHPREMVRARAAQCLHRMFVRAPSLLQHHMSPVQAALADKDPSVISAVLHILAILIQENPENHLSLGESLIQVLQQVMNRSFPAVYEYHNIPLPWLQIELLRVLGLLGSVCDSLSQQLHPILSEILHRYKVRENIAYAILYECIITITTVKPNSELLREVSTCVARFLQSSNHNLRFLGIKALTALIGVDPAYASSHQIVVVECLDEEDEAIQRKTLMLLQGIANYSNVKAICVKLQEQLSKSTDVYFKMDVAQRITQLAEKYVHWYIETMNSVLPHVTSSSRINELTAGVMHFIETNYVHFDEDFKQCLLEKYLTCLRDTTTPRPLLKLGVWVIGKISQNLTFGQSSRVICPMLELLSQRELDDESRSMALTVLTSLVVHQTLSTDDSAKLLLCDCLPLTTPFLKQKLKELRRLIKLSSNIPRIHYRDRLKMRDFTLSFLDDDVAMAIENGAAPYRLKTMRQREPDWTNTSLSAPVYESVYQQMSPAKSSSAHEHGSVASSLVSENSSNSDKTEQSTQNRTTGLNLTGVQRVWGREGLRNVDVRDDDAVKKTGLQSSNEATVSTEKRHEKQQLAQALFEGVTKPQQSWFTGSDHVETEEQFSLPKTDSSNWRAMHHEHQSLYHPHTDFNQSASILIPDQELPANEISYNYEVGNQGTMHHEHQSLSHPNKDFNQSGSSLYSDQDLLANENSSDRIVGHKGTNNQSEQTNICESERRELWVEGGMSSSLRITDSGEINLTENHLNSDVRGLQGAQHVIKTGLYDSSAAMSDQLNQSGGLLYEPFSQSAAMSDQLNQSGGWFDLSGQSGGLFGQSSQSDVLSHTSSQSDVLSHTSGQSGDLFGPSSEYMGAQSCISKDLNRETESDTIIQDSADSERKQVKRSIYDDFTSEDAL